MSNIKNFAVGILSMDKPEVPTNDTTSSLVKESVLSENDSERYSILFCISIWNISYLLTFRFRNADETDSDNRTQSEKLKE